MQKLKQLEFIYLYVIFKASMSILLDPQQELAQRRLYS
jgi:hypothetical protein